MDRVRDSNLRNQLEELLKMEELLWFQKSQVKWALEGDRCTNFFFISTLVQRRHNRIKQIRLDNGELAASRDIIGSTFMDRFHEVYCEDSMPYGVDLTPLIEPSVA